MPGRRQCRGDDCRNAALTAEAAACDRDLWPQTTPCRDGPTAAQPAKDRAWVGSFETISGREVHQLYGPNDLTGCDYEKQLGDPGWFPFTRGVHADMYRGRLWTMRQFTGFGTAEQTNKRFRFLLDKGQTGLSVAFDL